MQFGSSLIYYRGGFIYSGNSLYRIIHEEGSVIKTSGGYSYYYALKDHLGSTKVLCKGSGTSLITEQTTEYYPFGLAYSYNSVDKNAYLFSGKEYQKEVIGGTKLELYDFGSRFYDTELGIWSAVDPALQLVSPYGYCMNNPVCCVDPDGEFAFTAMFIGMAMNLGMQAGTGNINSWGDFFKSAGVGALSGLAGAGAGKLVSGALKLGGFSGGFFTGAAGGFSGGFVGSAGNAWTNGASFGDALNSGLRSGAGGALVGGVLEGVIRGFSVKKGYRFLDGGPDLETKLKILVEKNKNELISEIGEGGVKDVYLGNRKNLEGTGYKNSFGGMLNSKNIPVNGFHVQGNAVTLSVDKYAKISGNEIYLSKRTVRKMWQGSLSAKETLFHEWYHARDYYTGHASYLSSKYPNNYINMLEFRAHSFNYNRLPTPERLLRMEHYARKFWGLPGLF